MSEAYRHVPYDIECEQAILGSCLVDNAMIDRMCGANLTAEAFYDPLHQRLFSMMTYMPTEDVQVTPLTVWSFMKSDPGLNEVGGHAYLAGLAQAAPAIPNVRDLARIIIDLATRRALIGIGEDLVNWSYEAPHDRSVRTTIGETANRLLSIGDTSVRKLKTIGESSHVAIERMQKRMHPVEGEKARGISTGLRKLDNAIGGILPGDRLAIPARTGMGKSALAGGLALSAARAGHPVLVMDADMGGDQWAERTVCDMDRYLCPEEKPLQYNRFRTGHVSDAEWERFVLAQQGLNELPLHIDDNPMLTLSATRGRLRALAQAHPGEQGLLVVDFYQKTEAEGVHQDLNRDQFLTKAAYAYGDMVREIAQMPGGVAWSLVLLVQLLNKDTDSAGKLRRDPPSAAAVRETGGLEQAVDILFSPYRLAYFTEREEPDARYDLKDRPADWLKWRSELTEQQHRIRSLGWKLRGGATNALNLEFWCDMGSNSVRDEQPSKPVSQDVAAAIEAAYSQKELTF